MEGSYCDLSHLLYTMVRLDRAQHESERRRDEGPR